jgi:hypothetical protein
MMVGLGFCLLVNGVLAANVLIEAPRALQQQPAERQQVPASPFPHDKHATLFPLCSTCHAGIVEQGQAVWPEPRSCASCHDGVIQPVTTWTPRQGPRPGNIRFTHTAHHRAATARTPADSLLSRNCSGCHVVAGAPRMAVQPTLVGKCLDCHGFTAGHFDLPSEACATCHVPLSEATSLTRSEIARFPKPRSHLDPDFILSRHGHEARARGTSGVAASCATCHSRNLCASCHVNAPESPVITALAPDDRPPPYIGSLPVPPSHSTRDFLRTHGRDAERPEATCANCHARQSCMTCHMAAPPPAVSALPVAGPGRALGALLTRARPADHGRDFREKHGPAANARPASCATCHVRESCASCHVGAQARALAAMPAGGGQIPDAHWKRVPPPNHTSDFRERHGPEASARPATCETCHERSSCLACHRPTGGRQVEYHPSNFLTRHPSSAYAREASCSDCHNPAQFCQSCHQKSGLVAVARIGRRGYHDAFRGFSLGHGQAARQSLESCASCHAERDCTACHSSVGGGFRFNPHGPGFNPARAAAKNSSTCIACHGRVPGA